MECHRVSILLSPASLQRVGYTSWVVVTINAVIRYVRMCECGCGCVCKIKFPWAPLPCAVTLLESDIRRDNNYFLLALLTPTPITFSSLSLG